MSPPGRPDPGPPALRGLRTAGRSLWLVVLLAAVLRVAVAVPGLKAPETAFFRTDTPSYVLPALALLEEGRYVGAPGQTQPYTMRGPGYPAFLALVFGLLGKGLQLPVILFCVLGALACIPVFRAGCWFGGTAAGTVAAVLMALNLTSIAHAPLYLSDTLFALVAAWMLYFFTRFYFHQRLPDLWLAVLLDAAGTLIRPTGLLWIVPCLFLVLVFRRIPVRRRLLGAAGCLLIFTAVLAPWMYRNSLSGGGFRLDTNIGNTLYYHNCAALVSVVTGVPRVTLRDRWIAAAEAEFAAHPGRYADEDARTSYKLARARELIAAHKWTYLRLHFNPSILMPDAPTFYQLLGLAQAGRGTLDVLHRQGVLAAVRHYFGDRAWLLLPLIPALVVVGATYLGCLIQLGRWLRRREWFLGFFFLVFAAYYLVLPGPVVMPRYHLPALPLMCVMAGAVWARMLERRKLKISAAW